MQRTWKDELNYDYRLIGLATSLKEYQLCHYLNVILEADFVRLNNLKLESNERVRVPEFSVYRSVTENHREPLFVFGNKSKGDILVPELPRLDFLLQINGEPAERDVKQWVQDIQALSKVLLVFEVPLKKVKNKERLIYQEKEESVRYDISRKRFFNKNHL